MRAADSSDTLPSCSFTKVKTFSGSTFALNAIWLKRAENPQKFDLTLAYLLHTGMFDGKTETITKKAKTSAVTEFERILNSKENSVKGKTVTKTTETGILDEFLRM